MTEKPTAETIPDYADAPTWPVLPEEDDEKEYVAIEDLDEETQAEVRAAAEARAAARTVTDLPESAKLPPGGTGEPSGKEEAK